jgi:hypothetical protein
MLTVSTVVVADEPQNTITKHCASGAASSSKLDERWDSLSLMVVAKDLESQGESNFHLSFSAPAAECTLDTFVAGDATVTVTYNALEKGLSTLNYRFKIQQPDVTTEVLVLNSGMAAFVAGAGPVIHLSEEERGVISWYAMYKREPPYKVVRALVEQIIAGEAKPLMAVRWPPGAKEGEMLAFDTSRLK